MGGIKIGKFNLSWGGQQPSAAADKPGIESITSKPAAEAFGYQGFNNYVPIFPTFYDGETDNGEIGPIIKYYKNHYLLRMRSEQMYIESEINKAMVDKYVKWTIGTNLILKSEPQINVLSKFGVNLDSEAFSKDVEELWKTCANSNIFDMKGQMSLGEMLEESERKALIGGDILVVLRPSGPYITRQHIDGANVINPAGTSFNGTDYVAPSGYRVRQGVEIDENERHVAYHVKVNAYETIRIPAYGEKSKVRLAYLKYGIRDTEVTSTRGVPLYMACLQTAKKLGRYVDAALAGAEDRAKLSAVIEHDINGTGEDPFIQKRATASLGISPLYNQPNNNLATDINGINLENRVASSLKHTTVNLPRGAKITTVDGGIESNVPEFVGITADIMCAAIDMPPDVMWGKYNGSFSSSRMSGKAWERTFMKRRDRIGRQDLDVMYEAQVWLWVSYGLIQAPGLLSFFRKGNKIAIQAYLYTKWNGDKYPDIDELKTANFVRKAMGAAGDHLPLMTAEKAAEMIGESEYAGILKQYADELEDANEMGIPRQDARSANDGSQDPPEEDETDKEKED